jgi:hypothetical protein
MNQDRWIKYAWIDFFVGLVVFIVFAGYMGYIIMEHKRVEEMDRQFLQMNEEVGPVKTDIAPVKTD